MINYEIKTEGDVTIITVPTDGPHGTICFAYDSTFTDFINALNLKGIDAFVDLLIEDPNTAFTIFTQA